MIFQNSSKFTFFSLLLIIVIALTNLSQIPFFVNQGVTQIIIFPIWIFLLLYCVTTNKAPQIRGIKTFIIFLSLFIFLYISMSLIDNAYTRSSLPYAMLIATFILVISTCLGKHITQHELDQIYTTYIISTFILGLIVYRTYIFGQSIEGNIYLYEEKNSISQILLTAWVLILFTKFHAQKLIIKLIYILIFLFITYELLVLKSRATIIAIPITLIIGIINGKYVYNLRKTAIIITIIILMFLIFKSDVWRYIIDNIIFVGRDHHDLNNISSGRADEWQNFWNDWKYPLMGQGRCKRESLILTSLLEFGIIGGLPILLIALQPMLFSMKWYKFLKSDINFIILFTISINYCLNGIFEQLAPFGPGAKCYFLWFMYGIITAKVFSKRYKKRS